MKTYYKVSKYNLKFIPNISMQPLNALNEWYSRCDSYNGYIYIGFEDDEIKGYMDYEEYSDKFFEKNGWVYMGEFSLKRDRKLKLNKINESN